MSAARGFDIAIVGAGFCGVATAVQLARHWAGPPLRLALIEPRGRFGPGLAYGTDCLRHLLNVPAGALSALPDDPGHFVRWGQAHGRALRPETFAPRRWYGEYLADLLNESAQEARSRVTIEQISARVRDLTPRANNAQLALDDGRTLTARRAVLALGNFPPAEPAGLAAALRDSAFYVADPWRPGALSAPCAGDVLLIGSGLTAIDVALELDAAGFSGRIHAVSRRGLLPRPHRPPGAPQTMPPPPEVLHAPRTVAALLRGFRAAAARARAAGLDWRDVLTALRPVTPALWQGMPPAERARFLRHLQPFWDTHRHRVAPEAAAAIDGLRAQGRFRVLRGRIVDAAQQSGGLLVTVRPRAVAGKVELRVGRVINCTGPASDARRIPDELLTNLLRRGLAAPDPLGLGLRCDPGGALLDAAGRPSDWLRIIGPLRRGLVWEGTAVPELRVQAEELAERLCSELSHSMNDRPAHQSVECPE